MIVSVHAFTHKCLSLFVFQGIWMCKWCTVGCREKRDKTRTGKKKRQEQRVLTLCWHLFWGLLLYVCMVLTSSAEKFCQVWSGLTFSLSRHVYCSPIPIKISTLSVPVSLPLAQTCITFSILPHLYRLPLLLTVSIILTYTPMLNLNISSTLCPRVLICILSILCFSLCLTIPLTMQVNTAGALFAEIAMWEHRAIVATRVGVNEALFASIHFSLIFALSHHYP